MAKARRSAAQRAATRKMIAANRARSGKRRAPTRRKRRNPATTYGQRKTYARTARMNPVKRRRRGRSAAAPIRRRRTRRNMRRNPIRMNTIFRDLLRPAAVGAVGAIVNDAAFTYLPIPAQFKAPGMMRYASKGVSAVVMTWLASYVVKRDTAAQLGIGALTQLSAEVARNFLAANVPQLAPVAMEGMGLYVNSSPGMGYYNPAPTAGGGIGLYVPGSNASARLPNLANTQPGEASSMGMYTENGYSYS